MGRYYALERISTPVIPDAQRSGTQKGESGAGSRIDAGASSGMTNLLDDLDKTQIEKIADAIRDHYKPQGPSDEVPS